MFFYVFRIRPKYRIIIISRKKINWRWRLDLRGDSRCVVAVVICSRFLYIFMTCSIREGNEIFVFFSGHDSGGISRLFFIFMHRASWWREEEEIDGTFWRYFTSEFTSSSKLGSHFQLIFLQYLACDEKKPNLQKNNKILKGLFPL
jgi:hypothetical protein